MAAGGASGVDRLLTLMRAEFEHTTFGAVVAHASRSVKPMLERLESEARPIADLHTHYLMRSREFLPSRNQVEPYKGSFELLLQEVMARAE